MRIQSSKTNRKTKQNLWHAGYDQLLQAKPQSKSFEREKNIKGFFFPYLYVKIKLESHFGGWDRKMMSGVKTVTHPSYWLEYLPSDASEQITAIDLKWFCIYLYKPYNCLGIWLAKIWISSSITVSGCCMHTLCWNPKLDCSGLILQRGKGTGEGRWIPPASVLSGWDDF